jgi:hypothetical protein
MTGQPTILTTLSEHLLTESTPGATIRNRQKTGLVKRNYDIVLYEIRRGGRKTEDASPPLPQSQKPAERHFQQSLLFTEAYRIATNRMTRQTVFTGPPRI